MLRQRFFHLFHRFARFGNGLLAVALMALTFAPFNVAHSASNNSHSIHSAQLTLADLPDKAQAAISAVLERAKLTASDGAAFDQLGYSVSISGDGNTLVVGAPWGNGAIANQGAAYVFVKPGGGWGTTSTYTAKLTNSDHAYAYDWFGSSVAISADGNTIVVGAWYASRFTPPTTHEGRAYVFVKPGGGWATTSVNNAELNQSTYYGDDLFGWSVAISANGDTVVVGAPHMTFTYSQRGAAYVFTRPGGGWGSGGGTTFQTATLTASDGATNDYFGDSVAISGDGYTIVVGANGDDIGANADQGSAYVFVTSQFGWSETAKLTASDGVANDWFGASVSISGDGGAVVVGANGHDFNLASNVGSAYVFVMPLLGWTDTTETAELGATGGGTGYDEFGYSVAISADGNAILVGAYGVNGYLNPGAAYLFVKPGGGWSGVLTQPSKLTASDGAAGDRFGNSVSINSNGLTIAIGAPSSDIGANADQGSAYVYAVKKTLTVKSAGAQDGWILESAENSNIGGTLNASDATFNLGDAAANKQYRAILSFNTSTLNDAAVITKVTLKIKRPTTGYLVGNNNPFLWGLGLKADVCENFFGAALGLQLGDFNFNNLANCKLLAGTFVNAPIANWYSANILNTAFAKINKVGWTQFRLRFAKDDNNDNLADYMKFYSGDAGLTNAPQLIIQYYVP